MEPVRGEFRGSMRRRSGRLSRQIGPSCLRSPGSSPGGPTICIKFLASMCFTHKSAGHAMLYRYRTPDICMEILTEMQDRASGSGRSRNRVRSSSPRPQHHGSAQAGLFIPVASALKSPWRQGRWPPGLCRCTEASPPNDSSCKRQPRP